MRHGFGVRFNVFAVERRLNQPPLTQVVCAFAGQEAVAEQLFGLLQSPPLLELLLVSHKDVFDQIRVVDQKQPLPRERQGARHRPAERLGAGTQPGVAPERQQRLTGKQFAALEGYGEVIGKLYPAHAFIPGGLGVH